MDAITFPGPDEIDGFWALDKMHAPRPVTPLSFDLVIHTLADGFTKAQAEYDCPIMVTNLEVNHYMYAAFHPIPDEAELADRMTRYHEKLAEKVPSIGRTWEEEWKPAVRTKNEALKRADWSALTDDELAAKLDELTDHMRFQWWIHGHINFVLLSSSAFCDLYDKVLQPSESTESYQTLQGFHTRSVDASQGLWDLSRVVKASPALSELFRTKEGARPRRRPRPERRRPRLPAGASATTWTSSDGAATPSTTWPTSRGGRTRPSPSPASPGSWSSTTRRARSCATSGPRSQRERLLAEMRTRLADDPQTLAKLDELYEAARYSFPLTEDHAFYIDQLGVGVLRRFVLEVGRRLVAKDVIDDVEDVFFLHRDEVLDGLAAGGDRRALVAERRATFARAADVVPPGALGTPPPPPETPDPFMDALVFRLLGMVPPEENTDPNVLRGVAGSPGTYTGTARVVRSLVEAGDLEEGEVMVCEMTLPPWVPMFSIAGAVVTDVGGVLSHSAIVAREFDLPAVVGTQVGTVVIESGQQVTVDGTKGVVYLDGRA